MLVRFRGRPDDLSPRARWKSWFGGAPSAQNTLFHIISALLASHPLPRLSLHEAKRIRAASTSSDTNNLSLPHPLFSSPAPLPFDRHDWFIDRNGEEVRYVIDFYFDEGKASSMDAFSVDARPALDSAGSLHDRVKMGVRGTQTSASSRCAAFPCLAGVARGCDALRPTPAHSVCMSGMFSCTSAGVDGAPLLSADLRVVCAPRAALSDHWLAAHGPTAGGFCFRAVGQQQGAMRSLAELSSFVAAIRILRYGCQAAIFVVLGATISSRFSFREQRRGRIVCVLFLTARQVVDT